MRDIVFCDQGINQYPLIEKDVIKVLTLINNPYMYKFYL